MNSRPSPTLSVSLSRESSTTMPLACSCAACAARTVLARASHCERRSDKADAFTDSASALRSGSAVALASSRMSVWEILANASSDESAAFTVFRRMGRVGLRCDLTCALIVFVPMFAVSMSRLSAILPTRARTYCAAAASVIERVSSPWARSWASSMSANSPCTNGSSARGRVTDEYRTGTSAPRSLSPNRSTSALSWQITAMSFHVTFLSFRCSAEICHTMLSSSSFADRYSLPLREPSSSTFLVCGSLASSGRRRSDPSTAGSFPGRWANGSEDSSAEAIDRLTRDATMSR